MSRPSERASWEAHPNIRGPASTLLSIHDQFRVAAERLRHLVEREPEAALGWVAFAFRPLAETLHHHHRAEEVMLFPVVAGRTGVAPDQLVADHRELTDAIRLVESTLASEPTKESAKVAVESFAEVLRSHLDREEQLVVPLLLEMTPEEAWALIHRG